MTVWMWTGKASPCRMLTRRRSSSKRTAASRSGITLRQMLPAASLSRKSSLRCEKREIRPGEPYFSKIGPIRSESMVVGQIHRREGTMKRTIGCLLLIALGLYSAPCRAEEEETNKPQATPRREQLPSMKVRQELYQKYKAKLDEAGYRGTLVMMEGTGELNLNLTGTSIEDLSIIAGLPLSSLYLQGTKV